MDIEIFRKKILEQRKKLVDKIFQNPIIVLKIKHNCQTLNYPTDPCNLNSKYYIDFGFYIHKNLYSEIEHNCVKIFNKFIIIKFYESNKLINKIMNDITKNEQSEKSTGIHIVQIEMTNEIWNSWKKNCFNHLINCFNKRVESENLYTWSNIKFTYNYYPIFIDEFIETFNNNGWNVKFKYNFISSNKLLYYDCILTFKIPNLKIKND